MRTRIKSLTITDTNYNTYHGEIYSEIIKDEITRYYLEIKECEDIYPSIPAHTFILKSPKGKIVSELEVIISKNPESFITGDIRDLIDPKNTGVYQYFQIGNLFTYKKYRGNKFASMLLQSVIKYLDENFENSVIFTYAGVSTKEYIKEPKQEEFDNIINKVANFYDKNGFVDVNAFSQFEFGKHMVYLSNITSKPLVNAFSKFYQEQFNLYKNMFLNNSVNSKIVKDSELNSDLRKNRFKNKINKFINLFKPKMKIYDVDYQLGWTMCNTIEAKNFDDAYDKALDMLNNMSEEEQIDRFLDSAEGGFNIESITDVDTGKSR